MTEQEKLAAGQKSEELTLMEIYVILWDYRTSDIEVIQNHNPQKTV